MHNEKTRILAQLRGFRDSRPGPFWATVGLAGVSLFGMVAAFGTAQSGFDLQVPQKTVVEQLAVAPNAVEANSGSLYVHEERIERGDTVAGLLARLAVSDEAASQYLRTNPDVQLIHRQLRPGKVVTARVAEDGSLRQLVFPVAADGDRAMIVDRQSDGFHAHQEDLHLETRVEMKSGEIALSLFGATDAAGIPDGVATQLADIFGGDIDFHRDLRKGDRFAVTYEMSTYQGQPLRSGKILAAEFTNAGKTYRAVWFQADGGKGDYYTADGKNLRKAFLRSPLEFSRVTSGFTMARFHPILKEWRAHTGVDYGAPIGTRVKATADGKVDFVGTERGYGRVVILRHQSKYTTLYGHLSGFAAGLKKGAAVTQGEVIGYVGMSGWATGPHLHYEFRINNVYQNPLAVSLPEAPALSPTQKAQFVDFAQEQLSRLELVTGRSIASLD